MVQIFRKWLRLGFYIYVYFLFIFVQVDKKRTKKGPWRRPKMRFFGQFVRLRAQGQKQIYVKYTNHKKHPLSPRFQEAKAAQRLRNGRRTSNSLFEIYEM